MDPFTLLPVEVLPRVLATPACEVALRLTCKWYYGAVKAGLFKKVAPMSWMSDYWTLQTAVEPCQTITNFQNGYIPGATAATYGLDTNRTPSIASITYIWAVKCKTYMAAFAMGHDWGIVHVEDPANIFYLTGWYSGGSVPFGDIVKSIPATLGGGWDSIALSVEGATATCIYGTFENISKFIDADRGVALFRRR